MYVSIIVEGQGVRMEKEVKIALITGIVALLVGILQSDLLSGLLNTEPVTVTTTEGPANTTEGPANTTEGPANTTEGPANTPPKILSLVSDEDSPQPVGTEIMWTASAYDSDDNILYYKFLLRGKRTGNNFEKVRDWDTENTWTWTTTNEDIGVNSVQVQVRDGNHEKENAYDDKAPNKDYKILSIPTANFTYSQPNFGDPVEFDASESRDESGPIQLYEWDFDDGEDPISEYEDKVTHTYKEGGVYRVKLTVTNSDFITDSCDHDVEVRLPTSYQIRVKTKNKASPAVNLTLYGEYYDVETGQLDNKNLDDFEGKIDVFKFYELLDVGDIKKITLNVFGNVNEKYPWKPDWIEITNEKTEELWTFDITDVVDEVKIYGPYSPR